MFEISEAKKQILGKLVEHDRTPTDLAEEIGKSRETVYNHLHELHEMGVLSKTKVPAKTRPKTKYSIGEGFVQYVSVIPDQFSIRTITLSGNKGPLFRIWAIPQESFHPYLERYWWSLITHADTSQEEIRGLGVFGSVARGEADQDSDIDLILVVSAGTERYNDAVGTLRIEVEDRPKICMTEIYSEKEYRNSISHESNFLNRITDELHAIYDSDDILARPRQMIE